MMKVMVHSFHLSDVDDPEIYAAQPIWEWQQTESGKWIMEHSCPEPYWSMNADVNTMGYRVTIVATLEEKDATFFKLKWA